MAIRTTSDDWIRMKSNRMAVAVRHKRRTAGASVQNIPPSAHAERIKEGKKVQHESGDAMNIK
jgi:hypothetical protein